MYYYYLFCTINQELTVSSAGGHIRGAISTNHPSLTTNIPKWSSTKTLIGDRMKTAESRS